MPWTMNNLENLLILPAFNDYFPLNDEHVILICNAGCSQNWWAETRSKWRRWAVEWAGSSQWGGKELKMGQRCRKQRDATKEKSSSCWWKKRLTVGYKAGEQSWQKQSIWRSWTGSSQWGRDWLKVGQRCREWRAAANEKRGAVGRHQSACLHS